MNGRDREERLRKQLKIYPTDEDGAPNIIVNRKDLAYVLMTLDMLRRKIGEYLAEEIDDAEQTVGGK